MTAYLSSLLLTLVLAASAHENRLVNGDLNGSVDQTRRKDLPATLRAESKFLDVGRKDLLGVTAHGRGP